jgi:hypothetical protein
VEAVEGERGGGKGGEGRGFQETPTGELAGAGGVVFHMAG